MRILDLLGNPRLKGEYPRKTIDFGDVGEESGIGKRNGENESEGMRDYESKKEYSCSCMTMTM